MLGNTVERAVGWEVWSWGESKMGGIREGDIDRLGILMEQIMWEG